MHLLLILLLFPLAVSLPILTHYNKQISYQCSRKAIEAADIKTYLEPWTEDKLRIAKVAIEECVARALSNPEELAEEVYKNFKLTFVDLIQCAIKMKNERHTDECIKSMKPGGEFCDVWGSNGCMIKKYDEFCGAGMAGKIRDMVKFEIRGQTECIDKYFK